MNFKNKTKPLSLAFFMLTFAAYGGNVLAKDYYVATWGNDRAAGTYSSSFRTIAKASSLVGAGDRIIIRGGNYSERIVVKRSGAAGKPITYMAYPNEKVTINGSGVSVPYWGGLVDVNSQSNITIQGLSVINSKSAGIFGYKVNGITVANCYTYNTVSSGIGMQTGSNISVKGNEVVLANTTGNQENITLASIANFEVSNNHVHDGGKSYVGGEGIDVKSNSHNGKVFNNTVHNINRQGIYVDSYNDYLSDVSVYNNKVYTNNGDGIQVGNEAGGYLDRVYIYNNIVYNNKWTGIKVWGGGESGRSHDMGSVYITNNTVAKNGWIPWASGIATDNTRINKLSIVNNIVSQNTGFQIAIPTNLSTAKYSIQHNLVDNSNRGWRIQGSGDKLGSNAVNAVPKFIDASRGNFAIAGNSPAIAKGMVANGIPAFDFNNKSRGSHNDIGALEH